MKKKFLIGSLACLSLLVACGEVEAKPNYIENPLVNFDDNKEVYKNEFTELYDSLVNAGTSNSSIVDALVLKVAKKEIGTFEAGKESFISKERFDKLVNDYMVDKALSGQYSEDYLFQEEKFAKEQREALYTILDAKNEEYGEDFKADVELVPGITYEELFSGNYDDYKKEVVEPIIYERLLTAKYLYENKYKTIGRSAARNVRTIKIDNSSAEDKGSALRTLNNYVGGFLYASTSGATDADIKNVYPEAKAEDGTYPFDVESISNIWKGTDKATAEQKAFINGSNLSKESLYNLYDEIEKDLAKIDDETKDGYQIKEGLDYENSTYTNIISKYTGAYSYSIDWGVELETRKLNAQDLTEDDFFVEKTGLTGLPSNIRSDLFSMTVRNKLYSIGGTTFLLPEKQENTEFTFNPNFDSNDKVVASTLKFDTKEKALAAARNLIHYDSGSSTYYIVIVDDFRYSTTHLEGGESTAENVNEEKKAKAIDAAILLGENSTYQEDALLHYFEEYGLTYHDQDFYDYLSSTYEELFEE